MNQTTKLTHKDKTGIIHRDDPTVMIGERINPTGRKVVLHALQEGNFEMVRQDAVTQVEAGAKVLDVNAGLPDRKYVNAAFIALAIQAGLTCPITNPLVTEISTAV